MSIPKILLHYSPEVTRARNLGAPLVALESSVITHGLPYPENLHLAEAMQSDVRELGAVPATVGIIDGTIRVGFQPEELRRLAEGEGLRKVGPRDFARLIVKGESGGTTVAGTLVVAHAAGIRVFATGGIGGMHRGDPADVSADLPALAHKPVIVVCAGAKAVLDLPATLEFLETYGVPVVGFRTDEFPAFYTAESGLPVSVRADSPEEVVDIAQAHWGMGFDSALLVAQPPPTEAALAPDLVRVAIEQALLDSQTSSLRGQSVTPFLLDRVSELTGGASLRANLGLLRNNARLAAHIAMMLPGSKRWKRA